MEEERVHFEYVASYLFLCGSNFLDFRPRDSGITLQTHEGHYDGFEMFYDEGARCTI